MNESLEQGAYAKIRERIVSADFPPGTLLSENELSAQLGISRTPMHAAMARLEKEGLVNGLGTRGFIVAEISVPEFFAMHETLAALQCYAIGAVGARGEGFDTPRLKLDLDRQIEAQRVGDLLEYYASGIDFAATILRATGNESMMGVLRAFKDRMLCKVIAYRKQHPEEKPSFSRANNEKVYAALERGDREGAKAEIEANVEILRARLLGHGLG